MKARLSELYDQVQSSFWFVPSVLSVFSVTLAFVTIELDSRYFSQIDQGSFWLFGGRAGAARELLSTIAGSLITVIAVAFSVTIVALQQAATQYSPRVLRRFSADRGNQVVLGVYIATFLYSLLILRDVRSAAEDASASTSFVPALSVSVALFLAILSLGLLVYFIHHITKSIQVSTMLVGIRKELSHETRSLYPEPFRRDQLPAADYQVAIKAAAGLMGGTETVIRAKGDGYLRIVSIDELMKRTQKKEIALVWLPRSVGEYLVRGETVIRLWGDGKLDEQAKEDLLQCIVLGDERSNHQDAMFAIRQISDIAIKALSPGINDPTTAEECISHLKGALAEMLKRDIPPAMQHHGGVAYLVKRPDFSNYVEACFDQIRHFGRGQRHVTLFMLDAVQDLTDLAIDSNRLRPLKAQVEAILEELSSTSLSQGEQRAVREHAVAVLARIDQRRQEGMAA